MSKKLQESNGSMSYSLPCTSHSDLNDSHYKISLTFHFQTRIIITINIYHDVYSIVSDKELENLFDLSVKKLIIYIS
jgi:hypothetical protein